MESTLLQPSSILSLSKTLRSTTSITYPSIFSLLHSRHPRLFSTSNPLLTRRLVIAAIDVSVSNCASIRGFCGPLRCALAGGGGGGFGGENGGGGGGDGSDGGVPKVAAAVAAADEVSPLSPDAIILDVGGMTCGGCASKVKKILENQPQVSSASVNLATETAIVWPVSEAKAVPNWRQELGEMLAKHLTNCGFESNLRGQGDLEGDTP